MIIGYDTIGAMPFEVGTPPIVASNVFIRNSIIDELHIQSILTNDNTRENWTNGSILLAKFSGDLEAGNIAMRENPIDVIRIKRRNIQKLNFVTLKELEFNPDPTQIEYKDYGVSSDENYEYIVTPVDMSGIEGVMTSNNVSPRFEGWWLIDQDNPEENNFQFLYNLDDMTITTDEERTELDTFARYPKVYYGQKRAKKGVLSGVFIPENISVRKQFEKLDKILALRKPLLLKNGYGRNYIVDVYVPSETIFSRIKDMTKATLNWVEVGEYID